EEHVHIGERAGESASDNGIVALETELDGRSFVPSRRQDLHHSGCRDRWKNLVERRLSEKSFVRWPVKPHERAQRDRILRRDGNSAEIARKSWRSAKLLDIEISPNMRSPNDAIKSFILMNRRERAFFP